MGRARAGTLLVALALLALPRVAAGLALRDGNSLLEVDPGSPQALRDWVANGADYLVAGGFFYRVGQGPEASVASLELEVARPSDRDGNGDPDGLFLGYLGPAGRFRIEIELALLGGTPGSRFSSLSEQVRITNLAPLRLPFSFFELVDLGFLEPRDGERVDFQTLEAPLAAFANGLIQLSLASAGPFGRADVFLNAAFLPWTDRYQSGAPADLLALLSDGGASDLDPARSAGLLPDVAWAAQWSFELAPGASFLIGKDLLLFPIPEPGSGLLLAAALALLAAGRGGSPARRSRRALLE